MQHTSAGGRVRVSIQHTSAYVSIQHMSPYVSIQHTSAYVSWRARWCQHTAYVSIQLTSAGWRVGVSICTFVPVKQKNSGYTWLAIELGFSTEKMSEGASATPNSVQGDTPGMRQHTSAYVRISVRPHTSAYVGDAECPG